MTTKAHNNGAGIGILVTFIAALGSAAIGAFLVHKTYVNDAISAGVAYYAPSPDPFASSAVFTWRTNEQFAVRH